MINSISPKRAKELLDSNEEIILLDVREQWENNIARIEGSEIIPLSRLQEDFKKLNPNDKIIVYCHHGSRSFYAGSFLKQQGFTDIYNLEGGIDAWSSDVDPNVPTY